MQLSCCFEAPLQVRQPSRMPISSRVLVLWHRCVAALLQKQDSSGLQSCSDDHWRHAFFRCKFLVKIRIAKTLQSKCSLFQLKLELTLQLLQHWSQFSFMLNILHTAQEKDRTLHNHTSINSHPI